MTFKTFLLLCLVAMGFMFTANAQQEKPNFTSITTKDGLSSNTVNAILKDRYGLVWFATDDGLDKFDGTNFTIYRHKRGDPSSLQVNEILSLHEDKAGNLWVGTSGGSVSLYDRKKDAFVNFRLNALTNSVVMGICSDYLGRIWIAHYSGVNIIDPATMEISKPPVALNNSHSIVANCVFEDSRHRMWIGANEGLFQFDPKKKAWEHFLHSDSDSSSLNGNHVNVVAEDIKGNIWIGTTNGLSMLKPDKNDFINYRHNNKIGSTLNNNAISTIGVEGNKLWLGTEVGLSVLDINTGQIEKFGHNPRNIGSLTPRPIRCVFIDNQGIYWVGTFGGGIAKYDKNLNFFNYIKGNVFDERGLNASIVTAFAKGEKDEVFVGTEAKGLSSFNLRTKLFQHYTIRSKRNREEGLSILALELTRQKQLVIGTYADGLFILDPVSQNYRQLMQGSGLNDLNSNDIFCIKEMGNGELWLGTNGEGINILNKELKVIKRFTPQPTLGNDVKLPINGFIRDIIKDKNGQVWIATYGGGITVFNPASGIFTIYNTRNSKLPNDKVQSLLEDGTGQIWAGTFGGGLGVFNRNNNQFEVLSEKEGLQNSTVYKIVADKQGRVWVSTNKGISSIEIRTKKINNYTHHNGVQNSSFVYGAGLYVSTGEIFFGGLEGFNYFNPKNFKNNTNIPSVLFSDLRIGNQSVLASDDGPLKEHVSIATEINLDYKQNFAISFVALNYTSPEQNQYAYKLEGYDKDWNYVGTSNVASYTNIDPGKYVLRVKASNNDGVWNTKGTSIKINVHPPFWRTTYAYVFYILAVAGLLLYSRISSIQKLKRKFALKQEKIHAEQHRKEAERTHELDRLKIKFLTNLSHDFRTPISLILGPVDNLLSQATNESSVSHLQIIKRNGRRLLNLVNQLLDFRKMEEHELKLQLTNGELVAFVKEVSDSFNDLAERKKINFAFKSEIDQLYTFFDHDKIERILFNLLSNAFKFTLEGGKVYLELKKLENATDISKTWVSIKIIDTGIGIPEDKKEKIFESFFQNTTVSAILNQGTGIGLSITKEFVQMHGGTIKAESELERGSTFTIQLPFTPAEIPINIVEDLGVIKEPSNEAEPEEELTKEDFPVDLLKSKSDIPSILLVEDNEDFLFYLKDNLRMHYKILEAINGKEGWKKALALHPHLIVSDISMPQMDGIELCRKIKSDKRTNHIPIILLTALTGEQDLLKGLETGANDYITKPFNFEVLNVKIKNLLALNATLKNVYTRQIKVSGPEVEIQSDNEKLLNKIMLYLEENLTNPQLSVEDLSRHVRMSRSSLYGKLLELTGETPVEFIRSVKLTKGAVLLEKSDMSVSEISYSVGFSTPNYFAKSFKVKFNMLPSEYRNEKKKDGEKKNPEN